MNMKILNISSIIPLEGLARENDIILRLQDYLKNKFEFEFIIAKSLPYTPKFLCPFNKKWKKYNEYESEKELQVQGYKTYIYPWIMPPTSNFWINYLLIPLNILFFNTFIKNKILKIANDCDLILAQNNIPDSIVAYLISEKIKKPYILNARGDFNLKILSLPYLKKIYANSSQLITHSPQNFKKIKQKTDIQLIPHPIEDLFFSNNTTKEATTPIKLISVCRLLELKHLDWVIKALAQLKNKKYQFIYNIFGDGPELEKLKNLTHELELENEILFHGYKDHNEINKHLQNSQIFIMPSYPETLGRSFLEAAAANCLIIGHENTGVDGLLKHKESAIFVNRKNIDRELEYVFKNFSSNFLTTYLQNARNIVDELTWKNIGYRYYKLYKKITTNG